MIFNVKDSVDLNYSFVRVFLGKFPHSLAAKSTCASFFPDVPQQLTIANAQSSFTHIRLKMKYQPILSSKLMENGSPEASCDRYSRRVMGLIR